MKILVTMAITMAVLLTGRLGAEPVCTSTASNKLISCVNLQNQKLEKRDFRKVEWNGVHLKQMVISESNFRGAYLNQADFSQSLILSVNFSFAKLVQSNFESTRVYNADFRWADLRGANLFQMQVDQLTQFTGAKFNHQTKMPQAWGKYPYDEAVRRGMVPFFRIKNY